MEKKRWEMRKGVDCGREEGLRGGEKMRDADEGGLSTKKERGDEKRSG